MPATIGGADRDAARARFGIAAADRCLLVFGGSQGARSINLAAIEAFAGPQAADRDFHVLHISGARDFGEVRERLEPRARCPDTRCCEFEPDLAEALAASDLALARAGGSIFELAAAGGPAILVPYPHAAARHQHANADWMAAGGAAVVVEDSELDPASLHALAASCSRDQRRSAAMADGLARACQARRRRANRGGGPCGDRQGFGVMSKGESDLGRRALHFIAIGGAGMSGLALVCHQLGARVTGSDRAETSYLARLRAAGIDARVGHDPTRCPPTPRSWSRPAIPDDNPELAKARERGQRVIHRGELLAELCAQQAADRGRRARTARRRRRGCWTPARDPAPKPASFSAASCPAPAPPARPPTRAGGRGNG